MRSLSIPSALTLAVLAGCSGTSTGEAQAAIARGTASWIVLDLGSGEFAYRADVPDANIDAAYRTSKMAFRRVHTASGDVFVAIYELTQKQWDLLGGGPAQPWNDVDDAISQKAATPAGSEDHPAYNLSHADVLAALAAFTVAGGARLDLPTANEWTSACGTESGWWWGASATLDELTANAVVRESVVSLDRIDADGIDHGGPLPVGSKAANRWGLYDILGNVWEWTREGTQVRGGSWHDGAQSCRAEILGGSGNAIQDWSQIDYALIGARPVLRPRP